MSSTALVPFAFRYQGNPVRVITDEKGEPWFVAKDVCDVLGLDNPSYVLKRLDADEKASFKLAFGSPANIINEPGLYKLILRSDKPEAKPFQCWVTHEVLPRIRKTGGYVMGEENMSLEELSLSVIQMLKKKMDEQKLQLMEQQPKVEAAGKFLISYF